MASFYWSWRWPTGDRRAYKQLLDAQCSTVYIQRVVFSDAHPDDCVVCREAINDDTYTEVWGTIYIPGHDRRDVCLAHHVGCFEAQVDSFSQGAERLADRPQDGGAGPRAPIPVGAWDSWDHMGIEPA